MCLLAITDDTLDQAFSAKRAWPEWLESPDYPVLL